MMAFEWAHTPDSLTQSTALPHTCVRLELDVVIRAVRLPFSQYLCKYWLIIWPHYILICLLIILTFPIRQGGLGHCVCASVCDMCQVFSYLSIYSKLVANFLLRRHNLSA